MLQALVDWSKYFEVDDRFVVGWGIDLEEEKLFEEVRVLGLRECVESDLVEDTVEVVHVAQEVAGQQHRTGLVHYVVEDNRARMAAGDIVALVLHKPVNYLKQKQSYLVED